MGETPQTRCPEYYSKYIKQEWTGGKSKKSKSKKSRKTKRRYYKK
jgi:hypothetical protein